MLPLFHGVTANAKPYDVGADKDIDMQTASAEPSGVQNRKDDLHLGHVPNTSDTLMVQEPEVLRAEEVFRALVSSAKPLRVEHMLRALGRPVDNSNLDPTKSASLGLETGEAHAAPSFTVDDCRALARRLRRSAYPLNEAGIARFRTERGFSWAEDIGSDVALAYARYIRGLEARFLMDVDELEGYDPTLRRALGILMRIGRDPSDLRRVRLALKLTNVEPENAGFVPVGRMAGSALMAWCVQHQISLETQGLEDIASVLGGAVPLHDLDALARFFCDSILSVGEAEHDYSKIKVSADQLLNRRTSEMLHQAQSLLPMTEVSVCRGSYDANAPGSSHEGGGVLDVRPYPHDHRHMERIVAALRRVGFAAWFRAREANLHVHAVAIGDRDLSPAAQAQVVSFLAGEDGCVPAEKDPHAELAIPVPPWALKYAVATK